MCESKFALQSQAQTHIRIKHKHNSSKAVAADPTNPIVDGLFIVYPMVIQLFYNLYCSIFHIKFADIDYLSHAVTFKNFFLVKKNLF